VETGSSYSPAARRHGLAGHPVVAANVVPLSAVVTPAIIAFSIVLMIGDISQRSDRALRRVIKTRRGRIELNTASDATVHANSSSSALASFRSGASKPSVNQP
jgi:hypothetical protein